MKMMHGWVLALLVASSMGGRTTEAGEGQTPPASQSAVQETQVTLGSDQKWRFTDIEGRDQDPFADESVKFLVVVFVATDCPIANYYQPTINRLAKLDENKGVRFLLFYPDPDATAEELKLHAEAFEIELPVCADANFVLAARLKASATPEAFVVARDGQTKYRGRIDDTYVAWGKKRRTPTSNDLQDALDALLSGKAVVNPVTEPIGCYIPFELAKKAGVVKKAGAIQSAEGATQEEGRGE